MLYSSSWEESSALSKASSWIRSPPTLPPLSAVAAAVDAELVEVSVRLAVAVATISTPAPDMMELSSMMQPMLLESALALTSKLNKFMINNDLDLESADRRGRGRCKGKGGAVQSS